MARPSKQTVDYFPHVTRHGETMFIIESKYGNDGYAFWFKLLELIGSAKGHHLDCRNPTTWEYLLAKTRLQKDTVEDIIETLANLNAIDGKLWADYRVVWVSNFVEGVKDAYKKRKNLLPSKEGLFHRLSGLSGPKPSNDGVSDDGNRERKVKESKVEERKGKERKEKREGETRAREKKPRAPALSKKYGEFKNVSLTDEHVQDIRERYGKAKADEYVGKLSCHMQSTGKGYKDHYSTLLLWLQRDNVSARQICTKESPMPPGASLGAWRHPSTKIVTHKDTGQKGRQCLYCGKVDILQETEPG